MLFFPHNSMFAYKQTGSPQLPSTYGLKLNGEKINTTAFLYWKKDFIESALSTFAKYIHDDGRVYLEQYLAGNKWLPTNLQQALLPSKTAATTFLPWLIKYAGYKSTDVSKIELIQYRFVLNNGNATVKDSTLVFAQKTQKL